MACPLDGILGIVSRRWALLAINAIGNAGSARFGDLQTTITGISPRALTMRLQELVAEGLVKRTQHAEIPPRVEYTLTAAGRELQQALIPLMGWVQARSPAPHPATTPCHMALQEA